MSDHYIHIFSWHHMVYLTPANSCEGTYGFLFLVLGTPDEHYKEFLVYIVLIKGLLGSY